MRAGIARMDTGCQTLLSRDALQEIGKMVLFVVRECREEGMLVFACDAANRVKCRPAGISEMHRIAPAIGFVRAPLQESPRLQFIDQRHQTAR